MDIERDNRTELHIDDLYEKWFLEYASYVNLDRAIPYIHDGFKPVQRRILHAMKEQDDGRFTKVANLIGQTMQYHPHGDASIGDALVKLGQKDLLIETQGNWGDTRTGDVSAAPRYIEARLSKFALHTCYNDENTEWQLSYDGRKREPILLPVKFPLLLAQGAEGIGVGIRTNILPHNFIELCKASIKIIKKRPFELYPDFQNGGYIDVSNYQKGKQGGKIKSRAIIEKQDKSLVIKTIPYSETTSSVIDSILNEVDKGRVKIKKVIDNTSDQVEIILQIANNVSMDMTIDALYAFTKCEVTISPIGCCIIDQKPEFMGVDEMLKISTFNTRELLENELQIKKTNLENRWHFLSLEKIFFEEKIYKELEKKHASWDVVIDKIEEAFVPFLGKLKREVLREDYEKLTEKPVRRIYKLDIDELNTKILKIEDDISEIDFNINNIDDYTIDYFNQLIEKFGKGKERKSEIRVFESIKVKEVVVKNQKLYASFKEGFVGTGIKKEEYISDCTDIDDIIAFRKDGTMVVSKVSDKKFLGKDLIHVGIWKKKDERTTYNMIYVNPKAKKNYVKRFHVKSITRDKEYKIAKIEGAKVLYFTANPNGEAELVKVKLSSSCKARNKIFDFDFKEVAIKGKESQGNIITTYPILNVNLLQKGISTLGGIKYWLDKDIGRLNKDERGEYLGEYFAEDSILVLYKNGSYILTPHAEVVKIDMEGLLLIQKFDIQKPISAVYQDGESKNYYVKRFVIETKPDGKQYFFISDHQKSKLVFVSLKPNPVIQINILKGKKKEKDIEEVNLVEFIDIKGWKSQGNRLTHHQFTGKYEELESEKQIENQKPNDDILDDDSSISDEGEIPTSLFD